MPLGSFINSGPYETLNACDLRGECTYLHGYFYLLIKKVLNRSVLHFYVWFVLLVEFLNSVFVTEVFTNTTVVIILQYKNVSHLYIVYIYIHSVTCYISILKR